MILLIQQPNNGPIRIDYVVSEARARAHIAVGRDWHHRKLHARLFPGGPVRHRQLQAYFKPYRIRGTKWYRTYNARPVREFAKAARQPDFVLKDWMDERKPRPRPIKPAVKPLPPEPAHITRYHEFLAQKERQEADKAELEALDKAADDRDTHWTSDY